MDFILDAVNLVFIFVGVYFTVFCMLLYNAHEKKLYKIPELKRFPKVSVIIPAHNEEDVIEGTIEAVKKMDYPDKEIIVVDDGSTDSTYDVAKKIAGIKVIQKKQGGKASALNVGIKNAKGELIACVDSDSYPDRNVLLKTVPFIEEGADAVTTTVLVKNTKSIFEKLQEIEYAMVAWTRKLFEFIDAIYVTPGAFSIYRKDVLGKIGGFDEKNMTEDIEIAWRLIKNNYKIKMSLDARVYTHVPRTANSWWRQRVRWNIGGIQTTFKYFDCFRKKEFGSIGTFLLPLFSLSYLLSFIGIVFMGYSAFVLIRYVVGAALYGFNPIGQLFMYFKPDLFISLMAINLILTLFYLRINIKSIKKFADIPIRIKYFLLYSFVYICIFPFNLIHSSIKYLIGKYEW